MNDLPLIYRFGIPLTKSYVTTERGARQYVIEGVASDESRDQQGESVIQRGMNFQPLLDAGIINWDHQPGPENIIGEPIAAEIQSGPAFFVKGQLYVDDKPRAAEAWATAEAMRKAGGRRKLGWSVEGAVLQRLGPKLTRTEVRHLALTHQPVNSNSWAMISKSMTTATAQPLILENLDQQITSVLWGECNPDRRCYTNATGYFYGGRGGMLEHLVKCKGMHVDAAASLIKRLVDSGI
jgi:hypothetical protein